jgi:hypothetical protein
MMAEINQLVAQHLLIDQMSNLDHANIAFELDVGLGTAGRLVLCLRDQVVHGQPGSGSGVCDIDEVAAGLDALLSFLGNLGHMVDLSGQKQPVNGEYVQ